MKPHPNGTGSKRHLGEALIPVPRGEETHVDIQKVPSSIQTASLQMSQFRLLGYLCGGSSFYYTVALCADSVPSVPNNTLNNAVTELNNKQQQKEGGIQRNRRGPGDAFADEAESW